MCKRNRPLPLRVRNEGRATWWLAASLMALWVVMPVEAYASCKQPVYVIVHRCNDAADVPNEVLDSGTNAIEADFSYGRPVLWAEDKWYLEHDPLVNVNSVDLDAWLGGVKLALNFPNSPLSLIVLDIKDPDGPLLELYQKVRNALGPDINLIFSIPDFDDAKANFHKIKDALNDDPRAGAAVDFLVGEEKQAEVKAFFDGLRIVRYWFADGYNITDSPRSVDTNVVAGMALRDAGTECKDFHGVYTWTYEKESSIKGLFDKGVNGVLVNSDVCHDIVGIGDVWNPAQAVDYIQNLSGRKFATREDNPFDLSPAITCPTNKTVECTAPGGTPRADSQLAPFFAAATCSSGYCDPLSFSNNAPSFFGLGTTEVTFTGSGDANCTSNCAAMVTVTDTTLPLITCPSDIAQDLVSQQGNLVAFNVAASDTCDASAKVECNPPPGSLFAPGPPTMVTCTAKDTSSNQASCSFNVKIFTPQEVIANLEAAVAGLAGLNQGQKNSLQTLLTALLDSINASNTPSTCGQLDGFIAKVTQWISAGTLTSAEGQPLLTSAKNLKKTYGCL